MRVNSPDTLKPIHGFTIKHAGPLLWLHSKIDRLGKTSLSVFDKIRSAFSPVNDYHNPVRLLFFMLNFFIILARLKEVKMLLLEFIDIISSLSGC